MPNLRSQLTIIFLALCIGSTVIGDPVGVVAASLEVSELKIGEATVEIDQNPISLPQFNQSPSITIKSLDTIQISWSSDVSAVGTVLLQELSAGGQIHSVSTGSSSAKKEVVIDQLVPGARYGAVVLIQTSLGGLTQSELLSITLPKGFWQLWWRTVWPLSVESIRTSATLLIDQTAEFTGGLFDQLQNIL